MLFLNETGLMLQPLVRPPGGPRGERPVMYCWRRRDRLSVMPGCRCRPRRRVRLYFATARTSRRRRSSVHPAGAAAGARPLVVVMDRLEAHRAAAKRVRDDRRFEVESLPAYAPELNPARGRGAGRGTATWRTTSRRTRWTSRWNPLLLEITSCDQQLLRSLFDGAQLAL